MSISAANARRRAGLAPPAPAIREEPPEEGSAEDDPPEPATQAATQVRVQAQRAKFMAEPPPGPLTEDLPPEKVTLEELSKYSNHQSVLIPVTQLRWDVTCSWGQIRPLNNQIVEEYKEDVRRNPPRTAVNVLLRDMGNGMHSLIRIGLTFSLFAPHRAVYGDWGSTHQCGHTQRLS